MNSSLSCLKASTQPNRCESMKVWRFSFKKQRNPNISQKNVKFYDLKRISIAVDPWMHKAFSFRKDLRKNEPKQWSRKQIPSRFTSICVSYEVSGSRFEFRMMRQVDWGRFERILGRIHDLGLGFTRAWGNGVEERTRERRNEIKPVRKLKYLR